QPARHHVFATRVHRRNCIARREGSELLHSAVEKKIITDEQHPDSCLDQTGEGSVDFAISIFAPSPRRQEPPPKAKLAVLAGLDRLGSRDLRSVRPARRFCKARSCGVSGCALHRMWIDGTTYRWAEAKPMAAQG